MGDLKRKVYLKTMDQKRRHTGDRVPSMLSLNSSSCIYNNEYECCFLFLPPCFLGASSFLYFLVSLLNVSVSIPVSSKMYSIFPFSSPIPLWLVILLDWNLGCVLFLLARGQWPFFQVSIYIQPLKVVFNTN